MDDCFDVYLELHAGQLVEYVAHVVPDDGPRYLAVSVGTRFNGVSCHVVETDHVSQHADGFVERTESAI